jgi:hypothetical protein
MPVRTARPRVRPVWTFALRKGPYRAEMTRYLAQHPEYREELERAMRDLLADGIEPIIPHVREPFDAPHHY